MSAQPLFGREADQAAVAAAAGPVVPIAGDSGIGKSAFLASLHTSGPPNTIVAEPVMLSGIQGSLQSAFAESLADCVRFHAALHPQVMHRFWERLHQAAKKAGSAAGAKLGDIVLNRAFEIFESKVGEEVGQLVRAALNDVLEPAGASLESRLASFAEPDVAQGLAALATEVASFSGATVILRLDGAERLSEYDRALLVELTAVLPATVRIIVAVNSAIRSGRELTAALGMRGTPPIVLEALTVEAVEHWLTAAGVDVNRAQEIARLTSGYPLFIEMVLAMLAEGQGLDRITAPHAFTAILHESWQQIDPSVRARARRLAGFADPPSDEFLMEFLGLDRPALETLKEEMTRQSIFVQRSDGLVWFHDRRRAHIWQEVLSQAERIETAAHALSLASTWVEGREDIDDWAPTALSRLLPYAPEQDHFEGAAMLRDLSDDAVALLWALIELTAVNGTQDRFVATSEAVRFAISRSRRELNGVDALEALRERGSIVLASNDRAAIVGVGLPSRASIAALIGLIQERFAREPILHIARAVLESVVRPLAEPFTVARVAVGEGSLRSHRRALDDLAREAREQGSSTGEQALGIDLHVENLPVTVTLRFTGERERDAARARVEAFSSDEVRIDRVVELPPARVPFRMIADTLDEVALGQEMSTLMGFDAVALKTQMISRIAEASAAPTREALALSPSARTLVAGRDDACIELEVLESTRPGVARVDGSVLAGGGFSDPLLELRLRASGDLTGSERIGTRNYSRDSARTARDLLVGFSQAVERRGRAFNKGLRRFNLEMDPAGIAGAVRAAQGWRCALVEAATGTPSQADRSLLIWIQKESEPGGLRRSWLTSTVEVADGRGRLEVVFGSPPRLFMRPSSATQLELLGASSADEVVRTSEGDVYSVLAQLLGLDADDIQVVDPANPLAEAIRERGVPLSQMLLSDDCI